MVEGFNLNKEIEEEQERLEKEIDKCNCNNKSGFAQLTLGDCNLCDVRYAKHEGMRFAGEKFEEFIKIIAKTSDENDFDIMIEDGEDGEISISFSEFIRSEAGDKLI